MSILTPRERFTTLLASQPLLRGDAIVLLTGDGLSRVPTALELYRQGAARTILASGGVDAPPYSLTADALKADLVSAGVAPDRIETESRSTNTAQSCDAIAHRMHMAEWGRVLLVTSTYHMPRAFLSLLLAMGANEVEAHVVPVAVQQPWFTPLDGDPDQARIDLLDLEAAKIAQYQTKGDVASYDEGIEYLRRWEGR